MAKITAKANATDGTEYDVSLAGKTIILNIAGNLSAGSTNGITGQALFGSLCDLWKSGTNHYKYRFPFFMADGPTATMLELRGGWEFANTASVALIRDCGIRYTSDYAGATVTAEYACFVQAGSVHSPTDQPYYLLGSDTVPTDFGVANEFNECIKIYGDATHGNFNKRSAAYLYIREPGHTYGSYDLTTEQELSVLTYRKYLVPITVTDDTSLVNPSPSGSPYSGMTLTLGATTNTINGVLYNFAEGEIDANGGTCQQVYDWFQYLLLSTSDIDSGAGTQRGDTYRDGYLSLISGIITTSQGLTIKNIASADESNIVHVDDTGTGRQEVFVPSITISCVDSNGASTNFTTGTRVQIFNSGAAAASPWVLTTAYTVGQKVLRGTGAGTEEGAGLWFECTTAGTTAGTEPTWNTTLGSTTSDGTVTWTCRALEIYNNTPGAVSSVSVQYPSGANADSLMRVRAIAVNATTNAEAWQQTVLTATSTNVSVSVTQTSNSVYMANNEDGSLVTECSISANGIDIYVDDPNNTTTAQRIYNWYQYYLSTEDGIRASSDLISATDQTHYVFDNSIEIRNLDTSNPLNITGANIVPTSGNATDIFDLSNGASIALNFNRVEGFAYSSGSGLSTEEHDRLMALPTTNTGLTLGQYIALK